MYICLVYLLVKVFGFIYFIMFFATFMVNKDQYIYMYTYASVTSVVHRSTFFATWAS